MRVQLFKHATDYRIDFFITILLSGGANSAYPPAKNKIQKYQISKDMRSFLRVVKLQHEDVEKNNTT